MEFIITDSNRIDTAVLIDCTVDMELGIETENDFAISVPYSIYDAAIHRTGGYVYANGTEYGGKVSDISEDTSSGIITLMGDTWRGMLEKKIIIPPAGADYFTVSGDLSDCIKSLVGGRFGDIITASNDKLNISVSSYKINRFANMLQAIDKLCNDYGCKLSISADGSNDKLSVIISADPINDYSEEVEVSQDSDLSFKIETINRRYTHVIAAGSGELKDRLVVLYRVNSNGSLTEVSSIPNGDDVMELFFDYPNTDDKNDLRNEAANAVKELNTAGTQEVSLLNEYEDYAIGDIVGGRSYVTGQAVREKITQKVVTVINNTLTIQYKVGV